MKEVQSQLTQFLMANPGRSSREIFEHLDDALSYATLKRYLSQLVDQQLVTTSGKGKSTRYYISSAYKLLFPIDPEQYFLNEIDERVIIQDFSFALFDVLKQHEVFKKSELALLNQLHQTYLANIAANSPESNSKELERLAIDLSWKSAQIEGNTYSLLETERLLKEKETASGRSKDEAIMLLNHKEAIDFIVDHQDYIAPINRSNIEGIHTILTKDLNIDRNIRRRRVGISGTNYKPLDNEFQIIEAVESACALINGKTEVIEKAFLALLLISYIQPFVDGNKRTARIVSNAILINGNHCPLSFRTVDPIDYKKAMLIFYEQNNITPMKRIFLEQYAFAVNTYF